jgi:hypothetical protein
MKHSRTGSIGLVAALAVSLLISTGCAPGRLADLRDAGRVSAGLGIGLSADAKVGALTHPSLGFFATSANLGFDSRDVYGVFHEGRTSEPFASAWARGQNVPFGDALNASGWRAAFKVQDIDIALAAISEPLDGHDAPDVIVKHYKGKKLSGGVDIGYWLPIPRQDKLTDPMWTFNSATDLQLGATLVFVSGRVGLNVLETFDFLLGFVGMDIADDDPR